MTEVPDVSSQRSSPALLGLGRGRPLPATDSQGPTSPSSSTTPQWNSNGSNFDKKNDSSEDNTRFQSGFKSGNTTFFSQRKEQSGFSGLANNSRSQNTQIECYNCHETGHRARDCPQGRGNSRDHFNTSGEHNRTNNFGPSEFRGKTGFTSAANNSEGSYDRNQSNFNDDSQRKFTSDTGSRNDNRSQGFATSVGFRMNRGADTDRASHDNYQNNTQRNNNCYNCGMSGHRAFECQDRRKAHNQEEHQHGTRTRVFQNSSGQQQSAEGSGRPIAQCIPPPVPKTEDEIFHTATTIGVNFDKYIHGDVSCTPKGIVQPIEMYEEANLDTQVLSNIRRAQFKDPTLVQRYSIPCIRNRNDLMACAQTGSGKTAAFLIPIISNILESHKEDLSQKYNPPSPLCLVVSPTRELAIQTENEARKFANQTPITACSVIGGCEMQSLQVRLNEGCHILSATLGRLIDFVKRGKISLKHVAYFVLDEADRMLDDSFKRDIIELEEIGLPSKENRHTLMFSATFATDIQQLAKRFLRTNYIFLVVGKPGHANEDIGQTIEVVERNEKRERLMELLQNKLKSERCLIFVEEKRQADYIGAFISQKGFMSTTMHGDRTQQQRLEAVRQFSNGICPILVATSVAARGLDFPLIGYVINYDLPDTNDFYVHRIGRTGRAGHMGKSISFFDPHRESDCRIAPQLIETLTDAGQPVPEFLRKYANSDASNDRHHQHTTDIRHRQTGFTRSGPSVGFHRTSPFSGKTEDWDNN